MSERRKERYITEGNKGTTFGHFVYIEGEMTEESIEQAKAVVLNELIECMRNVAMENPEFFIIKDTRETDPLSVPTVAAKFRLPTVNIKSDMERRSDDDNG